MAQKYIITKIWKSRTFWEWRVPIYILGIDLVETLVNTNLLNPPTYPQSFINVSCKVSLKDFTDFKIGTVK